MPMCGITHGLEIKRPSCESLSFWESFLKLIRAELFLMILWVYTKYWNYRNHDEDHRDEIVEDALHQSDA